MARAVSSPAGESGGAEPAAPPATPVERELKREDFSEEWIAALAARAASLANYPMLSEAEREGSRRAFQAAVAPGADAWVFAYGSLMWNPAIHVVESRPGVVYGYNRSFCLTMMMGRGSPETPGLMLALDRGGCCRGVAHRIAAAEVESELAILWRREMLGGAYRPRWLEVRTATGPLRAIAFVANRAHPRYCGKLGRDAVARRIAAAAGMLGTNRHYLFRLAEHLDSLGIADGPMHRLAGAVRALAGDGQAEET
jgi:glutathione-specific gamma-glutamylcyclotransferase